MLNILLDLKKYVSLDFACVFMTKSLRYAEINLVFVKFSYIARLQVKGNTFYTFLAKKTTIRDIFWNFCGPTWKIYGDIMWQEVLRIKLRQVKLYAVMDVTK